MNRQQQIDTFLLEAHQLALSRLREHPERLADVFALLERWHDLRGPGRSDVYMDEWKRLAAQGVDAIEREVCGAGDRAAALRNTSPLSILITQQERSAMLRRARQET
jgi:hypothetical protein